MMSGNAGQVRRSAWVAGAAALVLGAGALRSAAQEALPDRPISNPVYTDIAQPKAEINVIYFHQRLPTMIDTRIGKVPLDGHAEALAVQLELPLSECLSLVANKTGYVDLNPQHTLSDQDGFGDIAAGLKWLFHSDENLALAARGTFEFPSGDDEVFQGNGDGNFSPALIGTYSTDCWVTNGVAGLILPLDRDDESTLSYVSAGVSRRVTERVSLLGELNWFHVLADGDGTHEFSDHQGGNLVPSVVEFEGGDYFNLGAGAADRDPDMVTAAFGVRLKASAGCSLGLGYECPLTPDSSSLLDDRLYANLQLRF